MGRLRAFTRLLAVAAVGNSGGSYLHTQQTNKGAENAMGQGVGLLK